KVMSYSGMVGDIATVLVAVAGAAYPLIAPVIGALGGFVTGSGTSTSVLFGGLQAQTAAQLGLSPSWIAAANIMGAGIGKMVCPQSIAVGAGAAGMQGRESEILGSTFKFFALYVAVAALVCMLGATVSG
ncbi:MAG: L-lactate permease, partial [Eggerthellales bacterium]|nr:L-lactate permease [Eggerthellales bacterium]